MTLRELGNGSIIKGLIAKTKVLVLLANILGWINRRLPDA